MSNASLTGISSTPAGHDEPPGTPEQALPSSLPTSPPSRANQSRAGTRQPTTVTSAPGQFCPLCSNPEPHSHYNLAHVVDFVRDGPTVKLRHEKVSVDDLLAPRSALQDQHILRELDLTPMPPGTERLFRWIHIPGNDLAWVTVCVMTIAQSLDLIMLM